MNEENKSHTPLNYMVGEYRKDGRRFAELELATLTAMWLEATRDWLRTRGNVPGVEMQDLTSEFVLRGIDPPYELVQTATARATGNANLGSIQTTPEQIRDEIMKFGNQRP
jgi:hypothetical protein